MRSAQTSFLGAVVLVALTTHAAHAQSASVNWSGPYVGAYGGGGGGQSSQQDDGIPVVATPTSTPTATPKPPARKKPPVVPPPPPPPPPPPAAVRADADGHYGIAGGFGGALIGYNYQFNQVVIGAEADIGGGSFTGSSGFCGTTPHLCGTTIDAEANVRGRLGLPIGRFLPYIAGGLALADMRAYDSLFGTSGRAVRAGYTIGGGLEYKVTPRIGLRLEYLHSQFGRTDLFDIVPGVSERISATSDVVRIGVSFSLYDPTPIPVVARY